MHTSFIRVGLITAALLAVPFVAMQYTSEVNWSAFDFIFAAVLIFGTGIVFELALRRSSTLAYRAASAMALIGAFLLVWINGAVGIIGSEDNPANLLYGVVLLVLIIGALLSSFKASGMAKTLFACAAVQFLVPIAALLIWKPEVQTPEETLGMTGVFVLNFLFVLLFAGSALLYRRANLMPDTV